MFRHYFADFQSIDIVSLKMKLSSNLLLFSAYTAVFGQSDEEDIISTEGAIAEFRNNGIDGNIKIINGMYL